MSLKGSILSPYSNRDLRLPVPASLSTAEGGQRLGFLRKLRSVPSAFLFLGIIVCVFLLFVVGRRLYWKEVPQQTLPPRFRPNRQPHATNRTSSASTDTQDAALDPPFQLPPAPLTQQPQCTNTGINPGAVTDSEGFTCPVHLLDPARPGCCSHAADVPQLSCRGCESEFACCDTLAYCVSCCLQQDADPRALLAARARNGHLYAQERDMFAACLSLCRTYSLSTEHENAFRHRELRFCYGDRAPPMQ